MAEKQLKVAVYKNNGETAVITVNEKDYDAAKVADAMENPQIESFRVGHNVYKTHSVQFVEVIEG